MVGNKGKGAGHGTRGQRLLVSGAFLIVAVLIGLHLLDRFRPWHLWEGFKRSYVTDAGRVVDHLQESRSTSEGQAYAMFFALVANDRRTFDMLLAWTEAELSDGDLVSNLPAWLWGHQGNGKWGVQDRNSATDADLWMAYSLIEAGRLWQHEAYRQLGRQLAKLTFDRNRVMLEEQGPMLLPAPHGFQLSEGLWRFNPSYLPPFLLAALQDEMPELGAGDVQKAAETLLRQAIRNGLVPDWYACCQAGEVIADPVTGMTGGYEAIRVYLWLSLSTRSNLNHGALFSKIQGMAEIINAVDAVPERIDIKTRRIEGTAPAGFVAAMLPYLGISGNDMLLSRLEKRVEASWRSHTVGERAHYYDAALGLFSLGWLHGQYSFDANGRLLTRWSGYGV